MNKICESNLCREVIPHLAPIQQGDAEPKEFPVATREEMEAFWDMEEEAIMQAEIRML